MNTAELTVLLTRMAIVDGRDVDQLTLEAWEPLIGDLQYQDAVDGLNAVYRSSPKRPTPADIREASSTYRSRREAQEARQREIERKQAGLCHPHRHTNAETPGNCTDHHTDSQSGRCDYCGDRP